MKNTYRATLKRTRDVGLAPPGGDLAQHLSLARDRVDDAT
jgi:hypothetical protein